MSQLNLGERYFTNRERISQVIHGVTELARETGTKLDEAISSSSLKHELHQPFLFLVCGEVNAGKSTLINCLTGTNLCPVSELPETRKISWYRHGEEPLDQDTSPQFREYSRPVKILRDFQIIDTPGVSSTASDNEEEIVQLAPKADFIIFVFPASNPWSAATWNLTSKIPADLHHRLIFIIQQIDQKKPVDIAVILEHMTDLAMKRIGIVPPILPVSGKLAQEANNSDLLDQRLYNESGFQDLKNLISELIYRSEARRSALKTWHNHASTSLYRIEDHMEESTRRNGSQNRFLNSLEDEIDAMRESLVSRLPRHLSDVAETFETEAIWVTRMLRKWLSICRSFFRVFIGDQTGIRTEALFIERLRSAVVTVAESDAQDVVLACKNHWKELGLRVKESIGTQIDDPENIAKALDDARQRFVQKLGSAAHQVIEDLHVRKELENELRQRNIALKSFIATALLSLSTGAVFGILAFPYLSWLFASIGLLFIFAGASISVITKSRISHDFQNSLLDTCGAFADALRTDYEDALRIFFQDYKSCLNSIRKHLASEQLSIEPKLGRWKNLFLTLKSLEQDL